MFANWSELLIVAVLALLLFGKGRISGVMGDLATGIKSFKRGMQDDAEEARHEAGGDAPPRPLPPA